MHTSFPDVDSRVELPRVLAAAIIRLPIEQRMLVIEFLRNAMCIRCGRDDANTDECNCVG